MTTTRTVRAETAGPATIRTSLQSQNLTVTAEARNHAELTISTPDDDGPSADVVNGAELVVRGSLLELRLPRTAGATTITQSGYGNSSVIVNGGGGVFIAGNVHGTVVVNGRVVSGGGSTVVVGGSPVTITAHVPYGSSINADSVSGDIEARGQIKDVTAYTTSGDVIVDLVDSVSATTVSGSIRVGDLCSRATLASTSGSITIHGEPTALVSARTVSGSVTSTGGMHLDASSVSGRVRSS